MGTNSDIAIKFKTEATIAHDFPNKGVNAHPPTFHKHRLRTNVLRKQTHSI